MGAGRVAAGELGGLDLAQDDGPGLAQPGDAGRVVAGIEIPERREITAGRQMFGEDQVLDPDGDAAQRPGRAVRISLFGGLGCLAGTVAIHADPGLDGRLTRLDTGKQGVNIGDGGEPAGAHPVQRLDRREFVKFRHVRFRRAGA